MSTFVASTLLPTVVRDLQARDRLGLLIAGSTLGLFVALPLATRVVRGLGARGTLTIGMVTYLGGTAAAATAQTPWVSRPASSSPGWRAACSPCSASARRSGSWTRRSG